MEAAATRFRATNAKSLEDLDIEAVKYVLKPLISQGAASRLKMNQISGRHLTYFAVQSVHRSTATLCSIGLVLGEALDVLSFCDIAGQVNQAPGPQTTQHSTHLPASALGSVQGSVQLAVGAGTAPQENLVGKIQHSQGVFGFESPGTAQPGGFSLVAEQSSAQPGSFSFGVAASPGVKMGASRDEQPSLSALFQSKPGEWACPSCMVKNAGDKTTCPCCGADKPDTSGAAGPALAKPSSTVGFNFGAAASPGVQTEASKDEQPPLFQSKPGEWACPSCMVKNAGDKSTCPCCGADKPGVSFGGAPAGASTGGGFTFGSSLAPKGSSVSGSEGFSFGGASTGVSFFEAPAGTSNGEGFSFGALASTIQADSSLSATGFSFGGASSTAVGVSFGEVLASASTDEGFSFGTVGSSVASGSGGSFGGQSVGSTAATSFSSSAASGAAKFTLPGDVDLGVLSDDERRVCESLFDSATTPLADFLAELLRGPLPVATMRRLIDRHVGHDVTPETCLWSASPQGGRREGSDEKRVDSVEADRGWTGF